MWECERGVVGMGREAPGGVVGAEAGQREVGAVGYGLAASEGGQMGVDGVVRAAGVGGAVLGPCLTASLHEGAGLRILAVARGVGVAGLVGLSRVANGWRLAHLLYVGVSITLALTVYVDRWTALGHVVGLAWDCGAVTTGPSCKPPA